MAEVQDDRLANEEPCCWLHFGFHSNVPQYYATSMKAGRDDIEWLTFRTTGSPMRSPVAGYTLVFRAMPLQVITNSYQIAPSQAQDLKYNRGREGFFATRRRT
ncbi:hypothetical protein Acr_23g0019010 [Actinidia rufa]|uniref:Uncharacterized protein n=1 Tax=Actinidia rufa TaxID=165716 RepID=A0A7J0GRT6_9ERIC|nr:hypothetical protein Acr_23g0019010 [Actinidia rufa]